MPDPALLEGGAKAFVYASLLVAIGASTVHWLLLRRTAGDLGAERVAALDHTLARVGLVAACTAFVSTLLRVWSHTVAAFGFEGSRSWDTLMLVALRSRWGQNWKVQIIAAAVCMVAAAATLRSRRFWPLATLSTVVFAASIPLLGHAAGNGPRIAVHVAHILAAGGWLGSLSVVMLITIRTPQLVRFLILHRFSALALPGAATVVTAGLVASWLYVGDITNLWLTDYGRVLALKAVLVCGVMVCGYVNWQRLRKLHTESASSFTLIEVALAVAVVIVTGYLTEITHP